MGKGSSGGGTQTSTTTNNPWGPLAPYLKEYMSLLNQLTTGQSGPNATGLAGGNPPQQQVAGFTPGQEQGLGLEYGAIPGQSMLANTAAGQAGNILAGGMLNPASNPYLTSYIQAGEQPLVNNYAAATAPSNMSAAELSGAFGGSADAENRALSNYNFGNNLANYTANVVEPAYQQGQQQLTQTLALSPTINQGLTVPGQTALSAGTLEQQQAQNELNTAYGNQYQNFMWPYQQLGYLGSGLTGLLPAGGRSASTYPNMYSGGGSSAALGGGLAGLGLFGSMFPNALPAFGGDITAGLGSAGGSLASLLPFLAGA